MAKAQWVADVLGIPLENSRGLTEFNLITTDSRKVQAGCLFIALVGETFDGHDFLASAIEKGAAAVLGMSSRLNALPASLLKKHSPILFPVPDSLEAYRQLGKSWRSGFQIPVVMIAGSNGKTTTKELLAAALRGRWSEVLKTTGSQNGFVGIPLTLLELRPEHQAAVIEVGIDEPGAMSKHIETVAPTLSLLTIIGPEHLEKLVDIETVAREENLAISEVAARGGKVLINCDDPYIAPLDRTILPSLKLSYTLNVKDPDPLRLHGKISDDTRSLEVSGATLLAPEVFKLPLPGRHNALNLLAAIAAALSLGLSPQEIRQGLEKFSGADGRSQLETLPNGVSVICDYYNSQPASLRAGLELLKQLAGPHTTWVCLADMLELGPLEEKFHREVAGWIKACGIQNIILYGKRMKWLESELKTQGFPYRAGGILAHFDTHDECATALKAKLASDSFLLIKGSRGMKMEEVWKLLKK